MLFDEPTRDESGGAESMDERRRDGTREDRQAAPAEAPLPWQVKAIGLIGVPSVIALFLVYNLVDVRNSDARTNATAMNGLATAISAAAAQAVAHTLESREQGQRLERYLQLICVNTAKTDDQKRDCFPR